MGRFRRWSISSAAHQRPDANPLTRLGAGVHPLVRARQRRDVLIVFYAALFPMMLNAWSGMRSVNQLWLRAAGAMGADEHAMFWKVILPGASPFIITGLRQAFLRAWIAVVGAEMLAASDWGSAG